MGVIWEDGCPLGHKLFSLVEIEKGDMEKLENEVASANSTSEEFILDAGPINKSRIEWIGKTNLC